MFTAKSLSEDTRKTFTFILENFFEGKKRKRDLEIVKKKYSENYTYDDKLCLPLYHKTTALLKHFRYKNFNEKNISFEFQRRNYASFGESEKEGRDFSWHYDDRVSFGKKVYTVIFYLRKDRTIKGGGLLYDLEETRKKNIRKVEVEEGTVVLFPGNIYHSPEPSTGFGCRDSIVVFVERTGDNK